MEKTVVTRSGISFAGLLFLVFLVLKLTGAIAWSWWWVTAPLWAPWLIAGAIVLIGGSIWLIAFLFMLSKLDKGE